MEAQQNPPAALRALSEASSLLRPAEVLPHKSLGYIMPHHIEPCWKIIREKIQKIADGEATLDDVIEAIKFFTNNEQFQSIYSKNHEKDPKDPNSLRKPMDNMLKYFFEQLEPGAKNVYQNHLLPAIAKLILEAPKLFPISQRILIFTQDDKRIGSLSRRQCACLIAHMVFCINFDQAQGLKLPNLIDFSAIYLNTGLNKNKAKKVQKLKCIFAYFERVLLDNKKTTEGNVVFERVCLEGVHNEDTWANCDETIKNAQILHEGNIEDQQNKLQVVFSDHQLGDHVLKIAATQQQIMSLTHPEMMLSILFFEELKKDETVRVYGAKRYSTSRGFGDTFEFAGAFEGDNQTERLHVIMDAQKYHEIQTESQFGKDWIIIELNKAYCGFNQEQYEDERTVATGKWGCGVFKGNPQLKFILQWIAASRAYRDLAFYSFGDTVNFRAEQTERIFKHYTGKEVQELYNDLIAVAVSMRGVPVNEAERINLFQALLARIDEKQE